MMKVAPEKKTFTQVCVVVSDVEKVSANWAEVLGVRQAQVQTVFSDGIIHYTYGKKAEYRDLRVAKYQLGSLILELIQPGAGPSPWKEFLEKHGQGVFHFCVFVDDREAFYQTLEGIGVGRPYHIGYHPNGSYSYVRSAEQLGLELSVNNTADNHDLMGRLLAGLVQPLDEVGQSSAADSQ